MEPPILTEWGHVKSVLSRIFRTFFQRALVDVEVVGEEWPAGHSSRGLGDGGLRQPLHVQIPPGSPAGGRHMSQPRVVP